MSNDWPSQSSNNEIPPFSHMHVSRANDLNRTHECVKRITITTHFLGVNATTTMCNTYKNKQNIRPMRRLRYQALKLTQNLSGVAPERSVRNEGATNTESRRWER